MKEGQVRPKWVPGAQQMSFSGAAPPRGLQVRLFLAHPSVGCRFHEWLGSSSGGWSLRSALAPGAGTDALSDPCRQVEPGRDPREGARAVGTT